MRISAAGNKPLHRRRWPRQRGFTLLELLVVVSIIAIASAGVVFSLRDSAQSLTEREAVRLVALLESARAQSRTRGVPVVWRSTASGFRFEGLPPGTLPEQWLDANTTASGGPLTLGPEPVIGAQTLTLGNRNNTAVLLRLATDGLRPFGLQSAAPAMAATGGTP